MGTGEVKVFRLTDGEAAKYEVPPFAYEIVSDGQRVRLEAPTLQGLLDLRDMIEMANEHEVPFLTVNREA